MPFSYTCTDFLRTLLEKLYRNGHDRMGTMELSVSQF